MTTEITEYSKTEAALADLASRYKDVVFDVTTTAGMDTARKGRAELRDYRVSLEKTRVEIKGPALERCRLIDAEAKRITAELVALESPIDALIKQEEQRKEREKAAREQAERERVARIQSDIETDLRMPAVHAVGADSKTIAVFLNDVRSIQVTKDRFGDFIPIAELAKVQTITKLEQLHTAAVKVEAELAELARLRAEQEQRDREADERRRAEAAQAAEEVRRRAEEEAAARKKIEDAERESRLRIEAEERAAREAREEADRVARIAREAEERKAAEERARLKAEQDAIDEQRRELERQRYEAERQARAKRDAEEREAERIVRQERETREAEERRQREAAQAEADRLAAIERERLEAEAAAQREIERQKTELLDARGILRTFQARFRGVAEFAPVVKAIDAYFSPKKAKAAPAKATA